MAEGKGLPWANLRRKDFSPLVFEENAPEVGGGIAREMERGNSSEVGRGIAREVERGNSPGGGRGNK